MRLGQSTAGQIAPAAISTVGGALAPNLALWLGIAVPVVGGIIGGAALAMTALLNRKRGAQKKASSEDANQVETILQESLGGYLSSTRTPEEQAVALDTFDRAWAWLASAEGCGNPALGTPGHNCIAERQRGGSAPWCPTGTGCDWFTLYRDPIANDPTPVQTAARLLPGLALPPLPSSSNLALFAGLGIAGLALVWAVSE